MFVRYRIDKQVEENSGVGGLNTLRARRRCHQQEPGRGVQPHRRALEPRHQRSCASSSGATSPTTWCARRSTQPTINRPSGNFGKPTNQPQGRTEDRWQFVNNFSYTLEHARLEGRRRLQPHSRHQLLQQQHRRHVHVRHRSPVRCQRSDDVSDAVHAEHRRPESAAAQRRLSACSRRTAGTCGRTSR